MIKIGHSQMKMEGNLIRSRKKTKGTMYNARNKIR